MRASDDDRERVAERLRQAAGEGRLLAHELEERLATALRARTYGELDSVVWDLPGTRVGVPDRRSSRSVAVLRRQPLAVVAILVAIALVVLIMAAFIVAAFWGGWLLIVAFFTLTHRGGRYRTGRYGGGRYGGRYRT
jgi:hypothetical protein